MNKNDGLPCALCQVETCAPCPEMAGEDGAVLGLLERMLQRDALEQERDIVIGRYGAGRIVYVQELNGLEPLPGCTIVSGRAPTLYQALLLAAEALDENEAAINDLGRERGDIRDDWP